VTERPDGSSSPTTGAKRLLELFAVIAFYLYFGGWVYANDLLSSFGISLAAVAPQTQYFVVYAYSVFFASPWGWLLLLLVAAGWFALARFRFVWWAELALAVVIATAPFPLIRLLAGARASEDAANIRGGKAKHVKLIARPEVAAKYPADVVTTLASGKLFLVLGTKERYWVVKQSTVEGVSELPAATLYDVPSLDFLVSIELDNIKAKP